MQSLSTQYRLLIGILCLCFKYCLRFVLSKLLLKLLFPDENTHTHSSSKIGHSSWMNGKGSILAPERGQTAWPWGQERQDPERPALTGLNCFYFTPWEHEPRKMVGLRGWSSKPGTGRGDTGRHLRVDIQVGVVECCQPMVLLEDGPVQAAPCLLTKGILSLNVSIIRATRTSWLLPPTAPQMSSTGSWYHSIRYCR